MRRVTIPPDCGDHRCDWPKRPLAARLFAHRNCGRGFTPRELSRDKPTPTGFVWAGLLALLLTLAVITPWAYLTYRLVERTGNSWGHTLIVRREGAPSGRAKTATP